MVILRSVLIVVMLLLVGACATGGPTKPCEIALVVSEDHGDRAAVVITEHLKAMQQTGGAARPVVLQEAITEAAGCGNAYKALLSTLEELGGRGGEFFLYWCGPVCVRGAGDNAEVCLGRNGAALRLEVLFELLVVAPSARVFVVVDSDVDAVGRDALARRLKDDRCTVWITGRGDLDRKGPETDDWAYKFVLQLEGQRGELAESTWKSMFESLGRRTQLAKFGAELRGFAWLGGGTAVAPTTPTTPTPTTAPTGDPQPAPAAEPAPTTSPARAPDSKPEGAATNG